MVLLESFFPVLYDILGIGELMRVVYPAIAILGDSVEVDSSSMSGDIHRDTLVHRLRNHICLALHLPERGIIVWKVILPKSTYGLYLSHEVYTTVLMRLIGQTARSGFTVDFINR